MIKEINIKNKIFRSKIPKYVWEVCETLQKNSFESYLVGGCVRDLLMDNIPKDFDVTTNAIPEEIIKIFGEENTVYENKFGTVGVKIKNNLENKNPETKITETIEIKEAKEKTETIVEVTTFRKEGNYEDFRRPSQLEWGKKLEEDLQRRDFTMNAMAYDILKDILIDIYKGQDDIKDKIIKTVGNTEERFQEDALRMLRAIRFSAQIDFVISQEITKSIFNLSINLEKISQERIRDEFVKILMTKNPMTALVTAQKLGILKYISPELEKGIGVDQNQAHKYDVYEHNLRTLQHACDKNWPLHVRLAALFHDISKPETRRWSSEMKDWTFYGHDVVGARVAKEILSRLKFTKEISETVILMVRWHMFFSDPEKITLSAVRRLVANVGENRVWDLMDLRVCDRIGTGRPKENPYRLRVYKAMVAEVLTQPISLKMLKTNGEKIMSYINEKPSKRIGYILHALFNEVLDNPEKNTEEYLSNRTLELNKMSDRELQDLSDIGKDKMEKENLEIKNEIREKFFVKPVDNK